MKRKYLQAARLARADYQYSQTLALEDYKEFCRTYYYVSQEARDLWDSFVLAAMNKQGGTLNPNTSRIPSLILSEGAT